MPPDTSDTHTSGQPSDLDRPDRLETGSREAGNIED
jgi:hypothetical protein